MAPSNLISPRHLPQLLPEVLPPLRRAQAQAPAPAPTQPRLLFHSKITKNSSLLTQSCVPSDFSSSYLQAPSWLVTCERLSLVQFGSRVTLSSNSSLVGSYAYLYQLECLFITLSAAGPIILVGVMLGIGAVAKSGAPHLDDDHKVGAECYQSSVKPDGSL